MVGPLSVRALFPLFALGILFFQSACPAMNFTEGDNSPPTPTGSPAIRQIQVIGQPVKVFDHARDQQEPYNIPDSPTTAWKEANGTVNLLISHFEAYRMRGPDLEHLTMDPDKIYSSSDSASQVAEDAYNYHHWLMGPYSLDGQRFYSLAHSEWYACLLNGDCAQIGSNGLGVTLNSWVNTLSSFTSADGGASWQLNVVNGNHVVANTGYHWTGSAALADRIYLHALNHSGMFSPTRVIKEGGSYYAIGFYQHRDFSQIDPAHGVYEAPIDRYGYALLRTNDITDPNGWQAWTSGSTWEPLANLTFGTFLPQQNGSALNAGPPQIIFDTNAQCYILIHALFSGGSAVYYMTTKSLANPAWSQSTPILGTAQLVTDPGGPVVGFDDSNYPSILDTNSQGFSFEFTGGSPLLFYSTSPSQYGGDNLARDLYRVQLSITYY
jgi:hypothetical protein